MKIILQIDLGTDKDEAQYVSRRVAEILDDAIAKGVAYMIDPTALKKVADKFGEFSKALANDDKKEAP